MNVAYLLLGSNIDPESNIPAAVNALTNTPLLILHKKSSIWRTKAVGSEADDFLNVAVMISTDCELSCLKEMVIGEIENSLGRIRTSDKNAPRTIDLDIIVFNDQVLDAAIFNLDHVLLPFFDLLPDLYSSDDGCSLAKLYNLKIQHTLARKISEPVIFSDAEGSQRAQIMKHFVPDQDR